MPEWYQPSSPHFIRPIPWLHPKAIVYLGIIVQPSFNVIEFGAGGSTLWFAQRVHAVITFENDPQWVEAIRLFTPMNVLIVASDHYKGVVVEGFEFVDLLFIDGEPVTLRANWLQSAPHIVRDGGWIVLDNANRPEYAAEREDLTKCAELVHTVNGNQGHTKYLVTEFWRVHASRNQSQS